MSENPAPPAPSAPMSAPVPQEHVAIFDPRMGFTLETLIEVLRTVMAPVRGIYSRDDQGNLISAVGQVVIPAGLARHFNLALVPAQKVG